MTNSENRVVDLTTPINTRRFKIHGSVNDLSVIDAIAKAGGVWEPEIMNTMARHISKGDVCLDIGANVGVHTLVMADLSESGHVHAFEPSSKNFTHLSENIRANHIRNATAYRVGLCHVPGDREFHYYDDYAGCSMAGDGGEGENIDKVMSDAWGASWRRATEHVEFSTLDIWAKAVALDRLDFIKIDVEGFERYVIEGGLDTLRRFRPTLVTEFNTKSLQSYYGIDPRSYYDLLAATYDQLSVIEADGRASPLSGFHELTVRLTPARFWADLLCTHGSKVAA